MKKPPSDWVRRNGEKLGERNTRKKCSKLLKGQKSILARESRRFEKIKEENT